MTSINLNTSSADILDTKINQINPTIQTNSLNSIIGTTSDNKTNLLKKYICSICSKSYNNQQYLNTHIRRSKKCNAALSKAATNLTTSINSTNQINNIDQNINDLNLINQSQPPQSTPPQSTTSQPPPLAKSLDMSDIYIQSLHNYVAEEKYTLNTQLQNITQQLVNEQLKTAELTQKLQESQISISRYIQLNARLQEQIDSLNKTVATRTKNKQTPDEIKQNIINIIMNSPLNISTVPDELEQQIYEFILSIVFNNQSVFKKIFICCK